MTDRAPAARDLAEQMADLLGASRSTPWPEVARREYERERAA